MALLLWAVLVSPQNSKLSSLQTQETTLQTQQTSLQAKLASLKTEQQKLSSQLRRPAEDRHPDPERPEPDRCRCRGVLVREPVQRPDRQLRRHPDPVQRLRPGHHGHRTTPATAAPAAGRRHGGPPPTGVVAVPTTLAVTGNYGQMTTFINGLDSFPRLFVIQTFVLAYGAASTSASSASASGCVLGSAALAAAGSQPPVGRRNATAAVRRAVQPGHHRVDLLHLDPERPGRLHQGHRRRPADAATTDTDRARCPVPADGEPRHPEPVRRVRPR